MRGGIGARCADIQRDSAGVAHRTKQRHRGRGIRHGGGVVRNLGPDTDGRNAAPGEDVLEHRFDAGRDIHRAAHVRQRHDGVRRWGGARQVHCARVRGGKWIGTQTNHLAYAELCGEFTDAGCELVPLGVRLVSGKEQDFLAVDVVAEHDFRRRPIQAGVDALAELHGWSTCAKVEVFVGVEGDQGGCP